MDSDHIDDAYCYIRALQAAGIERYRQRKGARRTRQLNDSLAKVTHLTDQLSLRESDLADARQQVEFLSKERDDALVRIEAIGKDVESANVTFTEHVKSIFECNKHVCFKNFIEG